MVKYTLRRLIQAIPTFFGITIFTYLLMAALFEELFPPMFAATLALARRADPRADAPWARAKNSGSPPTPPNARAGLFTPPGMHFLARANAA